MARAVRLPLDPLLSALGIQRIVDGCEGGQQPGQPLEGVAGALAARLCISPRMAQRLDAEGLSIDQADRYAVASGLHPSMVWPEWDRLAPGECDLSERGWCRCFSRERVRVAGGLCDRCGRRIEQSKSKRRSAA